MSAVMSEQQAGERLTKIVRGFKTAMLINTDMQGHPRARPTSIANHDDPERIHRLWSPAWRLWFPAGPEDPDIALVDCRAAAHGEFDERDMRQLRLRR